MCERWALNMETRANKITSETTVDGNCFVSPTKIKDFTPNCNGIRHVGSLHCVASSIIQTSIDEILLMEKIFIKVN